MNTFVCMHVYIHMIVFVLYTTQHQHIPLFMNTCRHMSYVEMSINKDQMVKDVNDT